MLRIKLLLIILLSVNFCFAQKSYYKDPDGKIMDSIAYVAFKEEKIEKLKAISNKVVINDNFKLSHKNSDSVVYTFHWDIRVGGAADQSKNFDPNNHINKEWPFPKLTTMNGDEIDIEKLKGKPTLINFWFTSCAPCIDEMPILNDLKDKYNESVNFVAVTFESKEKVIKFLKKNKYSFLQVAGAKKYIREDLKMNSFPLNVFLSKDGIVRFVVNGIPYVLNENKKLVMGDGTEFESKIQELLKM